MIGLLYITAFAVYLAVFVIVVWVSVRMANKHGIKGWKWGVPAGLFMYLIVFWDHIPTLIMHEYYCETEAGFWVYKTPEQQGLENINIKRKMSDDVVTTASSSSNKKVTKVTDQLGDLFEKTEFSLLPIIKIRSAVVHIESGQYLAEAVNFRAGYGNFSGYGLFGGEWKFWLDSKGCVISRPPGRWSGLNDYRDFIYKNGDIR